MAVLGAKIGFNGVSPESDRTPLQSVINQRDRDRQQNPRHREAIAAAFRDSKFIPCHSTMIAGSSKPMPPHQKLSGGTQKSLHSTPKSLAVVQLCRIKKSSRRCQKPLRVTPELFGVRRASFRSKRNCSEAGRNRSGSRGNHSATCSQIKHTLFPNPYCLFPQSKRDLLDQNAQGHRS